MLAMKTDQKVKQAIKSALGDALPLFKISTGIAKLVATQLEKNPRAKITQEFLLKALLKEGKNKIAFDAIQEKGLTDVARLKQAVENEKQGGVYGTIAEQQEEQRAVEDEILIVESEADDVDTDQEIEAEMESEEIAEELPLIKAHEIAALVSPETQSVINRYELSVAAGMPRAPVAYDAAAVKNFVKEMKETNYKNVSIDFERLKQIEEEKKAKAVTFAENRNDMRMVQDDVTMALPFAPVVPMKFDRKNFSGFKAA